MRKFYALLSGFTFCLLALTAKATPPVTPDAVSFTFTVDAANLNVNFVNTSTLGSEPGNRVAHWSFGDGTGAVTGPLQGTQHHYNASGTYNACLRIYRYTATDSVLSGQFCATIVLQPISTCQANFTTTGVAATPLSIYFLAQPLHSQNKKPVRVCWNFGDGRDTCIQYLTTYTGAYAVHHAYSQPGNYTVCVNILYDGGCQAQNCHGITVGVPDSCRAGFERINATATSNPLQATFRALPWHSNNKVPTRICWNFGDGRDTCINYTTGAGTAYTVNHTYAAPGVYPVCVNILYQGGCQAQQCNPILIGRPDSCGADFQRLQTNTTANPLTVHLQALPHHNNNKKPQRICWNFGDGRDTCVEYLNIYTGPYGIAHTYAQPGNYNVCVSIRYFGGCEAVKCKPLLVGRPDTCGADFERLAVTPNNNPLFVYFKALPAHNNNRKPSRVCWTFGDGRDTCINYPETFTGNYAVGHQYAHPGNYQVCVTIQYFGGCQATKCRPISITLPDSCRANFEQIAATGVTPLTISLRALPWHINNKKPLRICWTFGDGRDTCINYPVTYTGAYTVVHHYQQPGPYNVCVNIRYDGGCESRLCRTIQVPPPAPTCTAGFLETSPSVNSLLRYFTAVPGSVPPARPERICWNFGDGRDTCINLDPTQTNPSLSVSHLYPGPGTYRVCVQIRYVGGCIAYYCREITIAGNPQICGGYMTDSIVAPRTHLFRGFSIHAPNDNVLQYRWTFGDGSSAIGREVTHVFQQGGPYNVCLVITTRLGCETRICRTIPVAGSNLPALTISPNPVANGLTAAFHSRFTETVNIRILNGAGTVVRAWTRNAVAGMNTWTFDVSTLLPGIYSLSVQSPNQQASAVFVKQ